MLASSPASEIPNAKYSSSIALESVSLTAKRWTTHIERSARAVTSGHNKQTHLHDLVGRQRGGPNAVGMFNRQAK